MVSIFCWRYTHDLGKQSREVIWVTDAQLAAYLIYLHICFVKHEAGLLDFQKVKIGQGRLAGLLFEYHGEMRRGVSGIIRQHLQCNLFLKMFLHEMYAGFHQVAVIYGIDV